MHHLCCCHIINTPRIRQPIAGGDSLQSCIFHIDMGNMRIHIAGSLIGLFWCTSTTIDWCIDTPHSRMVMNPFQSHRILIFCPDALLRKPQPIIHGFQDSLSLFPERLRILTDDFGNTGCQFIAPIIIGRRMGHSTTAII